MKSFSVTGFFKSRYPLAILAGIVLAAAFPKIGIAGFAWIAPGLMLAVAIGTRGGDSFRLGYVAGLVHYLASLYWLLLIPVTGFPILGWTALSAFLALFPATWVWMAITLSGLTHPVSMFPSHGRDTGPRSQTWIRRTYWALTCAALWVALEMILARIFGGFPWNLLGASQYRIIPLIQIASVTGVYGVSFLLVWTSVSVLNAVLAILRRPHLRSVWLGEIMLPLLAVVVAFAAGVHQLGRVNEPSRTMKVTLVQPSIPQTMIWDQGQDTERFHELIRLSEVALTNETDLLIWPEAAVPKLLRYDDETFQAVTNLAGRHGVWMIIGADDAEPGRESGGAKDARRYYNSSFLISPQGRLMSRYRKRSLVIFGEYIPLVRWLPFVKWLTPVTGSFTPGTRAVPFELRDESESVPAAGSPEARLRPAAKTSVLICFEDNFPHLVRDYVDRDTDFLVNLTNNGWFGDSAAQWQHAANAVFRAIENGLPLVRCCNNGLTGWVDSQGRLRQIFRDASGSIYGQGYLTAEIPLLDDGQTRAPTFYHENGDWFGWSCFALPAIFFLGRKFLR